MRALIYSIYIASLLLCPGAWADGLTYNGHASSEHTTLQLTAEQVTGLKNNRKLVLNSKQKRKMLQETGISSVHDLWVFPASAKTCTCELANVAVRVKNTVEVPNFLYGRDLYNSDTASWAKRGDEKVAFLNKLKELKNPPEAVKLFLKAQELETSNKYKDAIPLFEEAIKLDRDLKWARRDLAGLLVQIGSDAKLADKLSWYQKALSVIDKEDALMINTIKQSIQRTSARLAARD